ncbi:MAG: hypothetical protein BGP10_10735 [Rhodanobacter sp. 68-29]|nr:DUF4177 domain-containing protein [Rhodanobacter sp.]ODU76024.1 MAG: hypothetical protein ABT17_00995 [Rhodanobacter sp. SCN 69-32]OJY62238.1 MAG: hypothetical protein BGP10_10735 [Rhodanobacter sp. 68-29]
MSGSWEYKVVTVKREGFFVSTHTPEDERLTEVLNREGAQGWELVNASIPTYMSPVTLFLKRPR